MPFAVGVNQFDGSAKYPLVEIAEALGLDPYVPIVECDPGSGARRRSCSSPCSAPHPSGRPRRLTGGAPPHEISDEALQLTQRSVVGRASRRCSPISLPHLAQSRQPRAPTRS